MGNFLFSVFFIAALGLFFFIANILGHLMKLDDYIRKYFYNSKTKQRDTE
jgi:hypothetical protein